MIGTPAYGGMVHIDYLRCLFEYTSAACGTARYDRNESLITRGAQCHPRHFSCSPRTRRISCFSTRTPVCRLWASLACEPRTAVIGAPVGLKGFDANGSRNWNVGRCVGVSGSLLKVENVGTAARCCRALPARAR